MVALNMTVDSQTGERAVRFDIDALVIAGWAGRNREAMEHHIAELEALGIARPKATPTFYRVSPSRLNSDPVVQATGENSSGEAELVLIAADGDLFVGLGSDHTDRKVEAYGVTVSKQMCDKPVADRVWPFSEVADHWDSLILRSYVIEDGERVLYQEGRVDGLLDPRDLIKRYTGTDTLADGTAMFCGTLPAIGGVRSFTSFECEVEDPKLSRTISFRYDTAILEDVG
ncbi:MAG: hypothetical protein CML24_07190 [Rhizobiales bacterium]|nr:hypothetical protein [Hyphomicrobiales bacterium]|tara:strand:+ start:19345 stop:20031 length:687 start_codon:yes stop_codon:yes gene_type:complete